jgi:hypothetical protein
LIASLEGCIGSALSARIDGETGIVHGVFLFSSVESAQAALPAVRERATKLGGESTKAVAIETSLEGSTVRVKGVVELAAAFRWALGQLGL